MTIFWICTHRVKIDFMPYTSTNIEKVAHYYDYTYNVKSTFHGNNSHIIHMLYVNICLQYLDMIQHVGKYLALLPGPLQDPLLNATLHHQPVDCYLFCLTQPVCTIHGLLVYSGVPVTVIENDLQPIHICMIRIRALHVHVKSANMIHCWISRIQCIVGT